MLFFSTDFDNNHHRLAIWQADEEANEYDPLAKYRRYMGRWCPCP